ncbi:DNA polymerase [Candidatus Parcubacteria bacterium]|nr:DNA polymerase [Candidatus Parcubacteria bacterium]
MKEKKQQQQQNKKRLVLLDVFAILHRAYHALPDFSSAKGEPTGGLYGTILMLVKIIEDLKPDYIIACYDMAEPTFRKEAYDGYKSGRKEKDEELKHQIDRSRDIFKVFNIPIYEKSGFEADDVLGALAEQGKDKVDVIIASGDMDTMQLVDDKKVRVYTLKKGIKETILYDEDGVIEKFGFVPKLLPDYKGLRGDPSDNIIGIVGIGEKTATTLIQNFGTIEEMYKKLKDEPEAFEKAGIKPRIINLLKEGEEEALFSKELATIRKDVPVELNLEGSEWKNGFDFEKINGLLRDLGFRSLVQRVKDAFGFKEEKASIESVNISQEELEEVAVALWLVNSSITNPTLEDILNFANTRDFAQAKEKIFKELKEKELENVFENIEKPIVSVVKEIGQRGIKVDKDYLEKLSGKYHEELDKLEKNIWQQAGEEFNIKSPKQLGEVLFDRMGIVLKNHKKTSTGVKSTNADVLERLKDDYPIVQEILQYRELQKLLSTYIDNIPKMLDENNRLHTEFLQAGTVTGRMASHEPNLQNIPTKTELGRAIRNAFVTDAGFKLVAFDYSQIELRLTALLSGDKKLIDVFSKGGDVHNAVASEVFGVSLEKVDKEMRRTAKVINFGILYGMGVNSLAKNLGADRKEAQKFYNEYFDKFSGLAGYLEKIKKDAQEKGYTKTFFGRRRYFEGINSKVPFVRAMAERMAINAPTQGTSADMIKIAIGRVDEYLKKEKLEKDAFLLLQVHDELIFEIREDLVGKVAPEIEKIMETIIPLEEAEGIKFEVNVSSGNNWGELKDYLE